MNERIIAAYAKARAHLLSQKASLAHWEGELSSSALSTATAIVALHQVDPTLHAEPIRLGVHWLLDHQNRDGGWGDTVISKSNLSTTLLCWSALRLCGLEGENGQRLRQVNMQADAWILRQVGSLEPWAVQKAVIARYGRDKTFSVPILMLCAISGTLGEAAWRRVLPLPFELAAFPRSWFGAMGLPVVSYALPALIAIGYARFFHAPPAWWNPLFWVRSWLWEKISPMLRTLQPSSGGYLEATPLTSFVTMALASAGERLHPCVPGAVEFLRRSMRTDGSWPIDTNLATWGTTLSVKALGEISPEITEWLLRQQYQEIHPFTHAEPGGWAWTDLPGGVPDADDTSGAVIALRHAGVGVKKAAQQGMVWLLQLQNRDGGIPTFCRGWGTLPFDRSTPEITAHALLAWWTWLSEVEPEPVFLEATRRALAYLERVQHEDGSWSPLWFGNEHTPHEDNPVYGTAMVVTYLTGSPRLYELAQDKIERGACYLRRVQRQDGSFGGDAAAPASLEETAVAAYALMGLQDPEAQQAGLRAVEWLVSATQGGTFFVAAPIGLYFARLWYHERLYPLIWSVQALRRACEITLQPSQE
jgi:squalene-hopene/tetraprenyl-beta-curcumene cyclase